MICIQNTLDRISSRLRKTSYRWISGERNREAFYALRADLEELQRIIKKERKANSIKEGISKEGSIGAILLAISVIIASINLRTNRTEQIAAAPGLDVLEKKNG